MTIQIIMPLAVIILSVCVLAIGVYQKSLVVALVCAIGGVAAGALAWWHLFNLSLKTI